MGCSSMAYIMQLKILEGMQIYLTINKTDEGIDGSDRRNHVNLYI